MAVKQTFVGDASKLNAELDRVQRGYAKLEEKLQRLTSESEKSQQAGERQAQSMGTAAEDAVLKLGRVVTGYMSVSTAISGVTDAMAKQLELQDRTLDRHTALAVQQQALLLNAGAQMPGLLPQISAIQAETNVPLEQLTAATSFAVSSKGEETTQRALQAVAASARLTPNRPEDIPVFTQVALQMMNAAGPGVLSPEAALGFAQSAAARASTPEAAQFFTNVAPVAFAGAIQDPTNRQRGMLEAASLMTMFTGRGDPEGTISSSATINYMGKIAEFFQTQETIADPVSLFGRLEALQQDETLRQAFIAGGGLKGKLAGKVRTQAVNLLTPDSAEAASLLAIRGDLALSPAAYDERVGLMATASPALQMSARQRESAAAAEMYMLRHPELGAQGLARQAVEEGLAGATGFWGAIDAQLERWPYRFLTSVGADPIATGEAALRSRRMSLEMGGVQPDERDQIRLLNRQLQVLEGLREMVSSAQSGSMVGAANEHPTRHNEN